MRLTLRPEYYTHNLARLAVYAGIEDILLAEVQAATPIGAAWQTVKDYTLSIRYPGETRFPARLGRDMIRSIGGNDGLVRWLIQRTA